jgi:integrase
VSPSAIAAIRLLVFTGCRLSEILMLKWEQVDEVQKCLRLPDSKTGAKIVHLNAPALEVLAGIKQRDDDPWVIGGAIDKRALVNLRKPWHRIRRAAGLDTTSGTRSPVSP